METNVALEALSALAQETRLEIFRLLVGKGKEGLPAGEIAEAMGGRQNTISTNLAILSRAGLIHGQRDGRHIRYSADFAAARDLIGFLLEDCCDGRPEICVPLMGTLDCFNQPAQGGCND
jgi:DNA-binding transcriptional ArsR family regulator